MEQLNLMTCRILGEDTAAIDITNTKGNTAKVRDMANTTEAEDMALNQRVAETVITVKKRRKAASTIGGNENTVRNNAVPTRTVNLGMTFRAFSMLR